METHFLYTSSQIIYYNYYMSKNTFFNVPDDIVAKIEALDLHYSSNCFRALYQKGNPRPSDFLPTFVDENQKRIRESRAQCGNMAKEVVSMHKATKVGDYAVSLGLSLEDVKKKFWKNESYKKDYPAIARGSTEPKRGISVKDNESHISYFLYDYLNNNPSSDFVTIEEAVIDE